MDTQDITCSALQSSALGTSGECCDEYVQSSDSCVCGCPTYSNGGGESLYWISGVILTAVIAVILASLMMRRPGRKPAGEIKKKK